MEGAAELHGVHGGKPNGIIVDAQEGVVDNCTGSTVPLRNNTKGAEAQVWEMRNQGKRQEDPMTFGDHVLKFLLEKLEVIGGAAVRAPEEGRGKLGRGPGWSGHSDGNTLEPETVQEVRGWMGQRPDLGMQVGRGADMVDELGPGGEPVPGTTKGMQGLTEFRRRIWRRTGAARSTRKARRKVGSHMTTSTGIRNYNGEARGRGPGHRLG